MNMKVIAIIFALIAVGMIFWYLEEIRSRDSNRGNYDSPPTATSADNAPLGSIHNLPVPEAVIQAKIYAATNVGIELGKIIVLTAYEKNWPDGCLGLARADEFCTQVVTPGWEITVQAKGETHIYRTNGDGSVIREQ